MAQQNELFYLGNDVERILYPEENLTTIANMFVGTLDGEYVGAINFMCPICQEGHQVAASMPKELMDGADNEAQLLGGAMLVTLQMAMPMVSNIIKQIHNVEITMDITETEN